VGEESDAGSQAAAFNILGGGAYVDPKTEGKDGTGSVSANDGWGPRRTKIREEVEYHCLKRPSF
jgi:hypothetical protein